MRITVIGIIGTLGAVMLAYAQGVPSSAEPQFIPDEFYTARIISIGVVSQKDAPLQTAIVEILNGKEVGKKIEIQYGGAFAAHGEKEVQEGDMVVVSKEEVMGQVMWYLEDTYRLPALAAIAALFAVLVVIFGRIRGVTAVIGLGFSVGVLGGYIIPRIIAGDNPLWVSLVGAAVIAIVSLYMAHGLNKRTTIALCGTLITLGISLGMSIVAVAMTKLSGLGTEGVFYLQSGGGYNIDLKGLLLGGIIIGVLGVLDDITTGQAAIVDELIQANPALSFREVYRRGLSVGREHIASLVNTLVLAYAGVSLPLLLIFAMNNTQPIWAFVNGEFMAVEIVRTLVGSISLVIAVPITTFLAAYYLRKKINSE